MIYDKVETGKLYVHREGGPLATYVMILNKRTEDFNYAIYYHSWHFTTENVSSWYDQNLIYNGLKSMTKEPPKREMIRDLFK